VDTDRPIKFLFERQGQSLLPFIGETDARVAAAESVELSVANREVDCVLRLERDGAVWYRHLEFQSGPDSNMAWRCFEYNSRLILHYRAPVLTTVVYLRPGADRGAEDAFRLYIGDRLAYEWRYDVVRLWEITVESAFASGKAGPLALVPLLQGGDTLEKVQEAVRRLEALPRPQSADALSVLFDFASPRYNIATLRSMLGKDRIMESYLWQMGVEEGEAKGLAQGEAKGLAKGEAKGLAKGEAKAARQICADLAKAFHPRVAKRVVPVIQACEQPERLRAWILECPKLSDAAFVALVTGKPAPSTRSRTSRPSRRSVPARKGR
jgi:predicted transposase YdaD